MPETTPDDEPTVIVPAALLVHVPPVTASVSVVVPERQTAEEPDIGPGIG